VLDERIAGENLETSIRLSLELTAQIGFDRIKNASALYPDKSVTIHC
jgi:hypothetical protein